MPEWWNWRCSLAVFGIVWGAFFAVRFWPGTASGFQIGLTFYWVGMLVHEWSRYWMKESIATYKRIIEIDDSIAKTLRDHIKILQDRLNGGSNGS